MFNCRMCTDDIASLLGVGDNHRRNASAKRRSRKTKERKVFDPRSSDEVKKLVQTWEGYVHPRAREYFTSHEALVEALSKIAKNINKDEDPILAVLELEGNSSDKKPTFVNRLLAYVFATDESFEALMKLPKAPFNMACGDQSCINVKHISAEPTSN